MYFIIFIISSLILFYFFLIYIDYKIKLLESKILYLFRERTGLIPSIFEVTKNYLNKHNEIFKNILYYRKIEFSQFSYNENFLKILENEKLIHNELNFIFKVSNKNIKLQKEGKFIYLREIVINKSIDLGKLIKIYKKISKKYNQLLNIKDLTIIGILIPLQKKESI